MFNLKPNVSNKIVDSNGNEYPSVRSLAQKLGISKTTILSKFYKDMPFVHEGVTYLPKKVQDEVTNDMSSTSEHMTPEMWEDFSEFREAKKVKELPFEKYSFKAKKHKEGYRYAVALFSDAHIEETVDPTTVLGLNEYNVDIAKQRIEKYFVNLASCLNQDNVKTLYFASLGDTISGFIWDELAQTNGITPLEATYLAQNLIYNGLEYICNNTFVEDIKFIGIVGNHSRTTKRIQHSNGYKMSYEWLMYKNIEKQCQLTGLPIKFCIPNSEIANIETEDGRKFIFAHGFQIKSTGNSTVCGIYPSLNRLSMKWAKNFKQDKIYIGHFHSCISIPNAVVNGSIIGFNTFALTNGFEYEVPAQMYEVYSTEIGLLLTRKIYVD